MGGDNPRRAAQRLGCGLEHERLLALKKDAANFDLEILTIPLIEMPGEGLLKLGDKRALDIPLIIDEGKSWSQKRLIRILMDSHGYSEKDAKRHIEFSNK